MKVMQIHNITRFNSGGNKLVDATIQMLRRRGVGVTPVFRNSKGLDETLRGKFRAFVTGIYSSSERYNITRVIKEEKPDVIHVHNLFPLFSPWVLVSCRQAKIPVVMTCHDFRMICPVWFQISRGNFCNKCVGGHEYWCILKNCRGNIWESTAYAIRTFVARKWRLYEDNVSIFVAPSKFVKDHLIACKATLKPVAIVPNMVTMPEKEIGLPDNGYIAYAGRFSPEKGIDTLMAAAKELPDLLFHLAGDYSPMPGVINTASNNVKFVGQLDQTQMAEFYKQAQIVVVPSKCAESFGMVAAEAMSCGRPVIGSRVGGLLEIIEDKVTGLLFEPGNPDDLVAKLKFLWEQPELRQKMGDSGREKVRRDYSEDVYYNGLMSIYKRAIENTNLID